MANISAFVLFPENVCPDLQIWAVLMSERFTIRMVKYFAKGISVISADLSKSSGTKARRCFVCINYLLNINLLSIYLLFKTSANSVFESRR